VVGPSLASIVGRKAASLPGYPYSAALRGSGIIWDAPSLDKWLAGAEQDVPGTLMPVSIEDTRTRADIIAYLQSSSAVLDKNVALTASHGNAVSSVP